MNIRISLFIAVALCLFVSCKKHHSSPGYSGWSTYAGTKEGNRYSSNDEINLKNVSQLKVAWTYSTGDKDSANRSQNQCNPIMVDGILSATTKKILFLAGAAATGNKICLSAPAWV